VKETFSFGYFVTVQPVFGMGAEYNPLAPLKKGGLRGLLTTT